MPSAWGHTRLLETDWRFITQESHCFSCGSVNRSPLYAHMTFKAFSPDFKKEMRENLLEAVQDQETFGYMEKEGLEQVQKNL